MSSRVWGLDRRQTLAVFAVVIAVSVVIGLVLGPLHDGGSGSTSGRTITPGSEASPHAVWVFGFETLRFDPSLRFEGRLAVQGFGDARGSDGRVDLYDAPSGRVGVLDSATNRLTRVGLVTPGTAQDDLFAPTIARRGADLWLVSAPGALVHFDGTTHESTAPLAVAPEVPSPVATGVVADSRGVYAVTAGPDGLTVARVDPAQRTVVATVAISQSGAFTLDGVALGGGRLWVLAAGTAHALDPDTLAPVQQVTVTGTGPGAARGVVVAGGTAWFLADDGASLVRVDGDHTQVALRILPQAPASFRIPAGLVAHGGRIYAMVPRGRAADDHAVRVAGYDAVHRRPLRAVDLPTELFAGAIAPT